MTAGEGRSDSSLGARRHGPPGAVIRSGGVRTRGRRRGPGRRVLGRSEARPERTARPRDSGSRAARGSRAHGKDISAVAVPEGTARGNGRELRGARRGASREGRGRRSSVLELRHTRAADRRTRAGVGCRGVPVQYSERRERKECMAQHRGQTETR